MKIFRGRKIDDNAPRMATHYTTRKSLEHIAKEGELVPYSDISDINTGYGDSTRYLFAFLQSPVDFESVWKADMGYGKGYERSVFDMIVNYIAKRDNHEHTIPNEFMEHFKRHHMARISFQLEPSDKVFVADTALWLDIEYKKYNKGKVPLERYRQNFKLPELIIANSIPSSRFVSVDEHPFGECDKCDSNQCCETADAQAYEMGKKLDGF